MITRQKHWIAYLKSLVNSETCLASSVGEGGGPVLTALESSAGVFMCIWPLSWLDMEGWLSSEAASRVD